MNSVVPRPSWPQDFRLLVRDRLTGLGYLPARDDSEMATQVDGRLNE